MHGSPDRLREHRRGALETYDMGYDHGDNAGQAVAAGHRHAARHRNGNVPRAVGLLCLILTVVGCGPPPLDTLPGALWDERWTIAGELLQDRDNADPYPLEWQDWVAVFDFPEKQARRIVRGNLPAPDGWTPIGGDLLAYNEDAHVLLWYARRPYGEETKGFGVRPEFADVWLYDLRSRQGRWIGHQQWKDVTGATWSSDGTKAAFAGTELRSTWEPRRGRVYVYDLAAEKLSEVADDGVVGHSPRDSRPPVWSEDGRYVYYASIGGRVVRLELGTGNRETLPISALAVVTVRGNEIVLIARDPIHEEAEWIVKRRLDAPDGGSPAIVLDKCGWIKELMVSPSRRFILYYDWRGYFTGGYVLLDAEAGKVYTRVAGYFPDLFQIRVTSFSNAGASRGE